MRDSAALTQPRPDGIVTYTTAAHREDEYEEAGFDTLLTMQQDHFWYRGRHRFLLRALCDALSKQDGAPAARCAIDLGGGCGGWIEYVRRRAPHLFGELALADSSRRALELAHGVVGDEVTRYHVDLLQLPWRIRWDVIFLFDVLEHIPQDVQAVREIAAALRPGGLLFVTTPALQCFWSYNDDFAQHQRRYRRKDFRRLARQAGLELCRARYFMFFLSPLLVLSRLRHPTPEQLRQQVQRAHRVPPGPVNALLSAVFALETPLGLRLPFPWGTSILGVFRRPSS